VSGPRAASGTSLLLGGQLHIAPVIEGVDTATRLREPAQGLLAGLPAAPLRAEAIHHRPGEVRRAEPPAPGTLLDHSVHGLDQLLDGDRLCHGIPPHALKWSDRCQVRSAWRKSSMCCLVNGMPVFWKNRGQPMRWIHSPIRSYFRASAAQTSTVNLVKFVVSFYKSAVRT